ncbi:hypothetical protein BGW38_010937 [Lunasporangiospora selenospora]|uniref:Cytochrome P450 n=1 Tax=Lunasporangiospora selenospora TaxID=979761 RepID=A0A9P6FVJ9_9FUNG|nr:hypothetical protein BGW38_010937 [Lunasporangiospora selenospora]
MIGLVSNASGLVVSEALRAAIPLGIGLASAAYLTAKAVSSKPNTSIPMVSLRAGDSTHDNEYNDDQDEFMARCEEECGPVFRVLYMNMDMTVVSGPLIREVFMNETFSAGDSIEELVGLRSFFTSIIKSNRDVDSRTIHEIVRDKVTLNLEMFTPRIVSQLVNNLDGKLEQLGTVVSDENEKATRILVESPLKMLQEMVAGAMASVFVGKEIAENREVIETFIYATMDFAKAFGSGQPRKATLWGKLSNKTRYNAHNPLNPLHKHLRVLVNAAEPVIIERRRREAEAIEKNIEYDRPDDVLQKLLDSTDKYGFVDIEDVCGHILILILASVHTTTDSSTNLLYYLAAFPQYIEQLNEERKEVLDLQQRTREEERQALINKNEVIPPELDPSHDRDMTSAAVKKMVHMDSFVREVFRHACPGRFLAIQELKTIGMLFVERFSSLEIQDPSYTKKALRSRMGTPMSTGLYFTKRT